MDQTGPVITDWFTYTRYRYFCRTPNKRLHHDLPQTNLVVDIPMGLKRYRHVLKIYNLL